MSDSISAILDLHDAPRTRNDSQGMLLSMATEQPRQLGELMLQALARQARLTKPAGSLGQLETLAVQLAALQAHHARQVMRLIRIQRDGLPRGERVIYVQPDFRHGTVL